MREHILGVPVDVVTMATALDFVKKYVAEPSNPVGFVLAVNPEKVLTLREDPRLLAFFEKASLLIPDGIGVVKALRLHGHRAERVPGADLMQQICSQSAENDLRLFLYGASEEVNAGAVEILKKRYPGIRIVGRQNGFIREEQMPELIQKINDSQAQILFIAMGSPKQEAWMEKYADKLTTVKLCQGIGGTLDTITGRVKRAPLIWQKLDLEWFFRFLHQPSRIKRQLRLLKFIYLALKE